MIWTTPFIVYRLTEEGLKEVYHALDIKKAKYWLGYIALPGDVLCKTPIHPQHSHITTQPEYWSHKEADGKTHSDEQRWKKYSANSKFPGTFPNEQIMESCEG